ncbi:HAMP domain-containing sensor histidine kinase [Rhodococcus maanshanensis]|uniref:sensor histidine kinase n=1 Tax=Rhodococcus maanshanensis TaxID=183556 RepID=UPI0022B38C87|nr:HAMP domain-containing sensor histidine kinase [Rhodococcus maanshanensis]MCZ4555985.1 HAMP domain-containing sensor histidine kinase [Rhodococcus maanshanensis]
MRPAWLRIDGLRTRLVLVFIAIVVIIAGGTAGVVSLMARSWIYFNAQDVATAQFRDELQSVNGTPVDGLTPAGLAPVFPSDMTLIANGEVVRQGSVDPATITSGFDDGLNSTGLIRFERLDSERILVGMSVYVMDVTAGDGNDDQTLVKAAAIRPLVGVQDKFDDLLRVVGITLTAGVLVSGLLGLWIASTLVRPLRRLDEAAARAADGELSVRLPEDGVTELAQVTTTFNNMVARNEAVIRGLEESEEQSRRFVADVSHELRTPLAALVPVSEILREEIPNLPPDAGAAARIVSSEIGKLTRLVEDLIEMSRHDSQQAHLVLDDVDLVELTERTLESRGWTETVELLTPESISARVDSRRIDIVVANLVGNALRHGAPPVRIELSAEPGYAVITVVDHGPGISPEDRQAIFRRFYKVDTARGRSEGSGLGLSLAVENVHLHGGSIGVDQVDGRTVFTVRLPGR